MFKYNEQCIWWARDPKCDPITFEKRRFVDDNGISKAEQWGIHNFHEHFVASCTNRVYQISVFQIESSISPYLLRSIIITIIIITDNVWFSRLPFHRLDICDVMWIGCMDKPTFLISIPYPYASYKKILMAYHRDKSIAFLFWIVLSRSQLFLSLSFQWC